MSFKLGSRYRGALLCMFCLGLVQLLLAQAVANDAAEQLILVNIGNEKNSLGHDMSFRLYKAPDGTTGTVDYVTFGSLQNAQAEIEEWIKLVTTIKDREDYDDESSHGFNDRILGEWKSPTDPGATLAVIIRRDKFSCYHIESPSMQVAIQIEQLIDVSPAKVSRQP